MDPNRRPQDESDSAPATPTDDPARADRQRLDGVFLPRRSDTEVVMENVTAAVSHFAKAMVQAEELRLRTVEREGELELALAQREGEFKLQTATKEGEFKLQTATKEGEFKLQTATKEGEFKLQTASKEVELELARIEREDRQHERAEKTHRVVMPLAAAGAFAVLLYALHLGVLAQSATALATIGVVLQFLRREAAEMKRKAEEKKDEPRE